MRLGPFAVAVANPPSHGTYVGGCRLATRLVWQRDDLAGGRALPLHHDDAQLGGEVKEVAQAGTGV